MGAPKGHKKWGGREAGTPNKSTQELVAICKKHKCNPFEGMVIIAMETPDPNKKFDRLARIAEYIYPKRKAIEHSGEVTTTQPTVKQESIEERIKNKKA